MISAVAGCELDSRSIERIVEHSALPEREMLPNSPLIRSEKPRINNGHQFRPSVQSLNSPNHAYQSGTSSASSSDRAGSYVIQNGRNGDSLCGSEHYTDSGIHQTDSNQLDDEHRLLNEDRDRELRMALAHEQQFGTFGRPSTLITNNRSTPLNAQYDTRLAMNSGNNQSVESLQPIFQSSNTFPTKNKHLSDQSLKRAGTKRFCPDWRCVLMCNMIIMSLLVILFLSGYYYVWPVFVQPLVKASQPIDGQWTAYQSWSQCSVSCGSAGYTTRRRFCGQPAPEDGGLDCLGDSTETKDCSAKIECPDCNRQCFKGTLNEQCTKCTCEHHIITGTVTDSDGNPLKSASIYKLGHYDKLAETDRTGKFRISKICANSDNLLLVTKEGYNPKSILPEAKSNDTAEGSIKLSILLAPQITKIPESKTRYENQSLKLCCEATDNQETSPQIQWYKNQELIPEGKFYNQSSTSLQITSLKPSDTGIYQCKALNKAGIDMTQEIKIQVKSLVDSACPSEPVKRMVPLGENCDIPELNVGMCVGAQGNQGAKCLHQDQYKNIFMAECSDPPSDFCCGPIEVKKLQISCKSPGSYKGNTYHVPIEKTIKCGCKKC